MPTHTENRVLPYTADQMFDLVADIVRYPEFLPWCQSARIIRQTEEGVIAELTVGYKMIRERFVSRVKLDRKKRMIDVEYISGPLKALKNDWHFARVKGGKCRVKFYVHFEFSMPLLAGMMNMFFDVAFRHMVSAFESRAAALYGATTDGQMM